MIHHGDLFDVLPTLAAESVDACVTDPPYGIGFMGREWDTFKPGTGAMRKLMHPREREAAKALVSDNPNIHGRHRSPALSPSQIDYDYSTAGLRAFQEWTERWAREVHRVLKPGAYIVVCCAPRSYHRMACGLEDAGFVIRDKFSWLFGSGFPKNLNLGDGKGTALKPAHEPIALAWKPFKGSITACHAKHGTAALNIDAARIKGESVHTTRNVALGSASGGIYGTATTPGVFDSHPLGRWPANVLLDEYAAAALDEQTGDLGLSSGNETRGEAHPHGIYGSRQKQGRDEIGYLDRGGASRFYKIVAPDCILCGTFSVDRATMSECKSTPADTAARRSRTIHQTIAATVLPSAHASLVGKIVQAAPSAANLCETCVTCIALALVEVRSSGSLKAASTAFPACIPSYKSSTLLPVLASFAALWVNIDTIPTTASLSLLFGSVLHAIENCTRPASLARDSDPPRFLYSAKPSREERDFGTRGMAKKDNCDISGRTPAGAGLNSPRAGAMRTSGAGNFHPTVKPVELMRYLVKLVTPLNGTVLDPFTGSGTTGMACRYEQREFIGIEREAEYFAIAERRIAAVAPLFSETA